MFLSGIPFGLSFLSIFVGGFQQGSTQWSGIMHYIPLNFFLTGNIHSYDGSVIVRRSVDLGEPVIYVSMNYRYDFSS